MKPNTALKTAARNAVPKLTRKPASVRSEELHPDLRPAGVARLQQQHAKRNDDDEAEIA
jgi:hypothetical protein